MSTICVMKVPVDWHDDGIYKGYRNLFLVGEDRPHVKKMFEFYKEIGTIPRECKFEQFPHNVIERVERDAEQINLLLKKLSVGSQGCLGVKDMKGFERDFESDGYKPKTLSEILGCLG